ncbi:LuxR C-terminal-related transcriptional regulator [Streptomyces sp. NPDC047028]|uniref:LuxR C-terminal-related transcriptional regulator n=1 Tax=Streptomyces sp. NPDC047028 TaxID=3155793 RepID=UPI0033FAD304
MSQSCDVPAYTVHDLGGQVTRWPLVGREREVAALRRTMVSRRSRGVVLSGAAGVGKSRLAEECLVHAVRAGFRGARATASVTASAVPLGALAHLLPVGIDMTDPVKGFATVSAALVKSDRRRWAVLIDDLHLLDATSVILLRQLMDAGLIRLIATVRSGEQTSEAVQVLVRGEDMHRIELAEFEPEQVEEVLQAALGGPVSRHSLRVLFELSGGNPQYLRELVCGALNAGTLTRDGEMWRLSPGNQLASTARLTELVGARLAAAGPAARPVLELLATCGALPLTEVEEAASWQTVADLEHAELIRVRQNSRRTQVALAHPLYAEVLRASVPALRRRAILLGHAQRVENHGARRRGDVLRVATWRLAATGHAAPDLLIQAAHLARAQHDYPQVSTLLNALPKPRHTVHTRLLLGEALSQIGKWKQAESTLAEADARAATEQQKLATTLARTANLMWGNADIPQALEINHQASDQITSQIGRHTLRINEGLLRVAAGQPNVGLSLLDDLESKHSETLDPNVWLRGVLMKSAALALLGRPGQARACVEHSSTVRTQLDSHILAAPSPIEDIPLVLTLTEIGRLTDARIFGENAYNRFSDSSLIARIWAAIFLGRAEWLAGHCASARRWYAEAASDARTADHAGALRCALAGLAACAALLGDLEAAQTALDEQHTIAPLDPGFVTAGEERLGQAWLLASRGRLDRARTMLTEAAAQARDTGHVTGEALLLTDVARLGGAAGIAQRLAELAQHCNDAFLPARAHLAAALAADDPSRLLDAASELEAIGADLLAAEAATAAAAAWRRAGHTRQATAATHLAEQAVARCQGTRTPLLSTSEATAALTKREREIALLAAAGTTSKDIAQALGLSVRTIDNHLSHAYAKLGVTTRRALAHALGGNKQQSAQSAGSFRGEPLRIRHRV